MHQCEIRIIVSGSVPFNLTYLIVFLCVQVIEIATTIVVSSCCNKSKSILIELYLFGNVTWIRWMVVAQYRNGDIFEHLPILAIDSTDFIVRRRNVDTLIVWIKSKKSSGKIIGCTPHDLKFIQINGTNPFILVVSKIQILVRSQGFIVPKSFFVFIEIYHGIISLKPELECIHISTVLSMNMESNASM